MSKILLIDDDSQVNEVVKATLEVLGHRVMSVEDPQQVAEAFASFHPDVTLIDYMLPGCSGLDVVRALGQSAPHSIRYLATGMADFKLIKQALGAGACSLLSKPYRITDLVALMELAALLELAVEAENDPAAANDSAELNCTVTREERSAVLRRLIAYAKARGAEDDVAVRCLPLVSGALLKNAFQHGGTSCNLGVQDSGAVFHLRLANDGPAFDWQKILARARSCMEKPCASGLQLVLALSDDLHYENDGRIACVTLSKNSPVH